MTAAIKPHRTPHSVDAVSGMIWQHTISEPSNYPFLVNLDAPEIQLAVEKEYPFLII